MKNKTYKKIVDITKELIKNTDNIFYKEDLELFLEDFIDFKEFADRQDLLNVIYTIVQDGYELSGFEIYEIPTSTVYIFYNQDKKQMFDICLENNNAVISYLDDKNNQKTAFNIKHAIENYNINFLK